MSSPTQRSLALLRKSWPLVQVTEKWNQFAKVRQDLYGFCDVLCVRDHWILAVQTTTAGHIGARYEKMRYLPSVRYWLDTRLGNRLIHIHGWKKTGKRGARKTWKCQTAILTLGSTHNVEIIWLADTGAVEMAQEVKPLNDPA